MRRRLKLLEYPDGRKLEYLYDQNGSRTSLKATLGTRVLETTFTYDGNNRLDHVVDPEGRIYDHGYDLNGNRETLDYPNDAHTQYQYNEQNHLKGLITTRNGTTIQSYAFTLYPAGNRHTIAEAGGKLRTYVYDDLYRLTSETVTGGPHQYAKVFTYDDVGNRETQTTTGGPTPPPGAISYGYDDRDRLTTETGVTGGYGYDTNGNLTDTADGATDYAWDRDNRMTTVTLPDGTTVSHAYDADGNRVQTTTTPPGGPAAVVKYLVDTSGSLSHVVAETNAAGALTTYYVRGDDLLAVMRPTGPTTWATKYAHADGIGSIRKLTDETGAVTDTYAYSAFGELLQHDGSDPQPYAFAGEPLDPNVGFQYHRARWMDPSGGRVIGIDPYPGRLEDPRTLHKYLYASADPVNRIDPTGLFAEMTIAGLLSITAILSTTIGGMSSLSSGARDFASSKCGPEIGPVLRTVLQRIEYDYERLPWQQQADARRTALLPPDAAHAWDINQLLDTSWLYRDLPECCRPSVGCSATVSVDGKCFSAGDVNYVMWGKMNRLMWHPYLIAYGMAIAWKRYTGKPITEDLEPWIKAGHSGWPGGLGTPPSRANAGCKVGSCRTAMPLTYSWMPHAP